MTDHFRSVPESERDNYIIYRLQEVQSIQSTKSHRAVVSNNLVPKTRDDVPLRGGLDTIGRPPVIY
jgi:hypothetical protein